MIVDIDGLKSRISTQLREFTDIAVVAMSGGADSTLVTALCAAALGPDQVHTVHLPMHSSDESSFNERSWRTAEKLKVRRQKILIKESVEALVAEISEAAGTNTLSRLNQGNARARARMAVLYGVSTHLSETMGVRVRVIGTGNLSEDYIGYDTKGGDALADVFPIGELFKSEVYQLLDYFRDQGLLAEDMIDRIPSAGLWDGQTDETELGYSYAEMEVSIRRLLGAKTLPENATSVDRFVWNRHLTHKHKHQAPEVFSLRCFCQ